MKQYYANLNAENPTHSLRNDDAIAVSANGNEITYAEFNQRMKIVAAKLATAGITDKHRVLVVGDNSDIISTVVLTWGAMYLNASPANTSSVQSSMEIDLKQRSANCDAVLWIDGTIDICTDLMNTTKSHPGENSVYFSSGTTRTSDALYTMVPGRYVYQPGVERGAAIIDEIILANNMLGDYTQLVTVCSSTWDIAWTPQIVCKCLLTGGAFHWVETDAEVPSAHAKYKANMMSVYPSQAHRLCEFEYDSPIDYIDVSGGVCKDDLVENIQRTMKPHTICDWFGTVGTGVMLVNVIKTGSTNCEWFTPFTETNLKMKLADNGVIWTSRGTEWHSDNDVFEEKDGKYRYTGRTSEEFISFGGGKIYPWEIETYVQDLATAEAANADNTYVFSMNGLDGYDRHGLIYSGDLNINLVGDMIAQLTKYKRPQKIFQVTHEFWSLYLKVGRTNMASRIDAHSEHILNTIHTHMHDNKDN